VTSTAKNRRQEDKGGEPELQSDIGLESAEETPSVFKRFGASYSLWPEQARRRRGPPLRPVASGFAVGVVFAIASYNVISNFVRPATVQEPAVQRIVGHVPIPAPTVTPAVTPAPAQLETKNRGSRTRAPAAKVTLPIIGSRPALPSAATDGRGSDGLVGEAPVAGLIASSPPSLIREEGEPAHPPAQEAGANEAKPAAVTERPLKPHKRIVRKQRERPTRYAAHYRQKRERPTSYAVRYRRKREQPTRYATRQRQEQFFPFYPTYSVSWW
jgi:hypothetical protein